MTTTCYARSAARSPPAPTSTWRSPSHSSRPPDFDVTRAEASDATVRFFDVGALVYYLRAIPWIVPDFDIDADRAALHRIHDVIEAEGSFGVGSYRFLIEARTMP